MDPRKQAILNALRAFAEQRPGLDPGNYISHGRDTAGRAMYRSESRSITQDLADARTLLAYVSAQDAITADMILNADAGGRLTVMGIYTNESKGPHSAKNTGGDFTTYVPQYVTGQYWSVEYRRAVCRLLSQVLWGYVREHRIPKPDDEGEYLLVSTMTAYPNIGDWLRAHFKREFGRRIASRYFD